MPDGYILLLVLILSVFLILASSCKYIGEKINFPAPILLVLAGSSLYFLQGVFPALENFILTPEILFMGLLPPLLFESAMHINYRKLKKDWFLIFGLGIGSVVLGTLLGGAVLHLVLGFPIWVSLLFAALISPTDPVAVISIFKNLGVPQRLLQIVDMSSMINDASAVFVTKLILSLASLAFAGETIIASGGDVFEIIWFTIISTLGAVVVGVSLAFLVGWTIQNLKNEMLIEVSFTFVLAFLSYIIAQEIFGFSGILATISAAIFMGNFGREKFSPEVKKYMKKIWEYVAFLGNSLIFLLVGFSFGLADLFNNLNLILIVSLLLLAVRSVSVYPVWFLNNSLSNKNIPLSWTHIINWGGIRGALPIALALSLPENGSFAFRGEIISLTIGVVLMSLLINGLTIKRMIRWFKIDEPTLLEKIQSSIAGTIAATKSRKYIKTLNVLGEISKISEQEVDKRYKKQILEISTHFRNLSKKDRNNIKKVFYKMAFQIEKETFIKLFEQDIISENILFKLNSKIEEGVDLIEEGIFPEEFNQDKVMRALSKKSKKGFKLKDHFLYRKARELANLEVVQQISIFEDVDILKDIYQEIVDTYNKLIQKNRKISNDLLLKNKDKIEKYEKDFCDCEFVAMENKIIQDLTEEGQLDSTTIKILRKGLV